MVWPFTAATAPSEVSPAHALIAPSRTVPWRSDIPFHISIIAEHSARGVESKVKLIPEAHADELYLFAFGVGFANPATGRHFTAGVSVCVPHPREDVVFVPRVVHEAGRVEVFGEVYVVSAVEVNALSVG